MKTRAKRILESIPNDFLYKDTAKNSKFALMQMLRDSIVGEIDAISLYDVQINSVDDEEVKSVLTSIRNEEIAHIGELYALVKKVDSGIEKKVSSGEDEVKELLMKSGVYDKVFPKA